MLKSLKCSPIRTEQPFSFTLSFSLSLSIYIYIYIYMYIYIYIYIHTNIPQQSISTGMAAMSLRMSCFSSTAVQSFTPYSSSLR